VAKVNSCLFCVNYDLAIIDLIVSSMRVMQAGKSDDLPGISYSATEASSAVIDFPML